MVKYHRHEHWKYLHAAIIVKTINQNKKQSKFVLDDPTMQYEKDKDTSLYITLMVKYHRHEHWKYLQAAIIVKTINQKKKQSKFVLDDPTMQYDKDKDTSLWWWNTIVTSIENTYILQSSSKR